ncbi:hypothetical protein WOLCODRAFT_130080 [Wolfiporia cocos MD-104 SS10]|uniref:F-box domain-containing protein n=1 Tax=Wolfiporia cocos (strain MD-104) TaxID=742152 RepID=A0A2H3IVC1_WOLCO|nr:hypothetical protein WOLCODRAFT_130080 [Wolfiporia cocos MD-104 SS10]
MASWREYFEKGITSFQENKLNESLDLFTKAIDNGAKEYIVFDSRAAVYEKIGKTKESLRDSKRVIDLAPNRWQYDHALQMINLALERVRREDSKRRRELDALRQQIVQGIDQARARESVISYHFGNLPFEVASTIFTLVLTDDHTHAVVLAQVCKNWRTAVLHNSRLWSTLVLSHKKPARKAKLWRQRSHGRITELKLLPGLRNTPWALDELKDMPLDVLKVLRVTSFPLHEIHARLPFLSSDVLRNLEILEIHECEGSLPNPWLWDVADTRLRTLSIDSSTFDWTAAVQHYRHLQHFHFRGTLTRSAESSVLSLLRQNQKLRSLSLIFSLSNTSIPDSSEGDDGTISLPLLTELSVEYHDLVDNTILPLLIIPAIRTLHIPKGTRPLDPLLRHLSHTGAAASLVELRIQKCTFQASSLLDVLRVATELQLLELKYFGSTLVNDITEALAGVINDDKHNAAGTDALSNSAYLCPRLRHIDFSCCPYLKSTSIMELVRARSAILPISTNGEVNPSTEKPSIAPLEALIIDECPAIDASVLPWLRNKVSMVRCRFAIGKNARWKR